MDSMKLDTLMSKISTLYDFSDIEYKNAFPGTVWHYTDKKGLQGIIRNDKIVFWLTKSDCLADHTEGEVIEEVLKRTIEEIKSNCSFESGFSKIINELHIPKDRSLFYCRKDGNIWNSTEPYDTYIACFCLSENAKEMWEEYTNEREGYSLEFDRNLFNEIFNLVNVQPGRGYVNLHIQKVLYDEDKQVRYLIKKIKQAYDVYTFAGKNDNVPVATNFIAEALQSILNQLRFSCKHKRYEFENEVRAVIYLPRNRSNLKTNNLEVITVNNKEVAELTLDRNNRLRAVRVSPYVKNPGLIDKTKEWLQGMGYGIEVSRPDPLEV